MAGNRTQVNCLEGSYAHHYTTIATQKAFPLHRCQFLRKVYAKSNPAFKIMQTAELVGIFLLSSSLFPILVKDPSKDHNTGF